jgi:nucleoside phosphorylase
LEVRGVLRRLPPATRRVLTVRTVGLGAATLDRLEQAQWSNRPAVVLVGGLAGGCAPGLRSGDVVVGDPVTERAGPGTDADPGLRVRAVEALEAARLRYRVGPLLTVDRVIATPDAKAAWWQAQGALAVDMESAHVLAWARRAGLRALAVRAIADGPDDEVPPELGAVLGTDGRMRPMSLARLVGRPALLGGAWRLGRRSRQALGSLARFIRAFVDHPGEP